MKPAQFLAMVLGPMPIGFEYFVLKTMLILCNFFMLVPLASLQLIRC